MPRERKGAIINRGTSIFARVRYTDDFGKVRSIERKAENRTDARQILKRLLSQIDESGVKGIEVESLTFKQLAEDYGQRKLIPATYHINGNSVTKVSGLRSYKTPQGWLKTLINYFSNKKVKNITHADIEDYKLHRLKEPTIRGTQRAMASINRELELLRTIMRFAIRQRWITQSPFELGSPLISKADEVKRERVITLEEEKRLLEACEGEKTIEYIWRGKTVSAQVKNKREHLRPIIITAVDTAMRKNEILQLRWQDVDFPGKEIKITAMNSKTLKARVVGMTQRVINELKKLWDISPKDINEQVFGIKDNFKKSFASA